MKKVIIYNEPSYRTGGVESIYQFIHALNCTGCNGYIVFNNNNFSDPVPDEYKKYNIKTLPIAEDVVENLIILPEVWTHRLGEIKNAKKGIWWLSVDNNHGNFQSFDDDSIIHFYQSEYAKQYLIDHRCKNIVPLHDYISGIEYDNTPKEDIICYNPAKGGPATAFVLKQCPNFKFIPLVNMTKAQIVDTLSRSKIYLDFGHHPGRDRIPREAALLHNIVVTSMLGSAKFDEDIPIPSVYKLKELNQSIQGYILDKLVNYDIHINNFNGYREKIKLQQTEMYNESMHIYAYY